MSEAITFDGRGPLASALRKRGRNPSARTAQQEYVAHLTACLAGRRPAFADAETGVGKTLGYLIPMMSEAAAQRGEVRPVVVISTATVALQQQLMRDDLPVALDAVAQAYGVEMQAALRVGKGQIVDCDALHDAASELGNEKDQILADEMVEWCQERLLEGELPLRSDLVADFADRFDILPKWLVTDLTDLKPGHPAAHARTAELYRQRVEDCDNADVLIVNHHLLALHMMSPFLWQADRPAHIVVDEADRLPSVIESITRSHVPFSRLSRMVEGIGGAGRVQEIIERVSSLAMDLSDTAWRGAGGSVVPLSRLDENRRREVLSVIGDLRTAIADMLREQAVRGTAPANVRDQIATVQRYAADLDRVARTAEVGDLNKALICYSPVREYPGVASVRDGAGRMIAKKLWSEPDQPVAGLLFTSATLSTLAHDAGAVPRRALTGFIKSCGFEASEISAESCAVIAPKRFGEMDFVRPDPDAPSAFLAQTSGGVSEGETGEFSLTHNPEALSYWREMTLAAARQGGRVLVLLPAHRDIAALAAELGDMEDRVVVQTPGFQTAAAIARFLSREDSIWLSASAWEGVNLPGQIDHIVIPRLPFRPPSLEDTLVQRYLAELTGNASTGSGVVFQRVLADARRRLRQGIGRGIRSHDDRVKLWLCDPRWPLTQRELDTMLLDQPHQWSATMRRAVPDRFRRKLDASPRFEPEAV